MNVAPATAHKWWGRWQHATDRSVSRGAGRGIAARVRIVLRSERRLSVSSGSVRRAGARTSGRGAWPGLSAAHDRRVHAVLKRHGHLTPSALERARRSGALSGLSPARCCTWTSSVWRGLTVPGHWATGQRGESAQDPQRRLGLPARRDRRSQPLPVRRTTRPRGRRHQRRHAHPRDRALHQLGSTPRGGDDRQRAVYTRSRRFSELLPRSAPSTSPHRPTPPGGTARPSESSALSKTNGPTRTPGHSQQRTRALRSFVRYYNRRRPHSSLGDRPPISRVHNVPGYDS